MTLMKSKETICEFCKKNKATVYVDITTSDLICKECRKAFYEQSRTRLKEKIKNIRIKKLNHLCLQQDENAFCYKIIGGFMYIYIPIITKDIHNKTVLRDIEFKVDYCPFCGEDEELIDNAYEDDPEGVRDNFFQPEDL
jgi:hypothetical protein